MDGLTGFFDAIGAVYPKAEIQRCIVHQIRYFTKFISYKDIKLFIKEAYQALTEDVALEARESLEGNWEKKYSSSVTSWCNNWVKFPPHFKYPAEIRKLIYTTNSIENFKRQFRKVTKNQTLFPTEDALFKLLYLAMMDITKSGQVGAGIGDISLTN